VRVQWAQVAVLDQAGDVHVRVVDVEPEVASQWLAQFDDNADHGDIFERGKLCQQWRGQVGHQAPHVGQRHGADDLVEGLEAGGGFDALHFAVGHHDLADRLRQADLATTGFNRRLDAVEQRLRAAFEVAQFFFEQTLARAPDAPNATPDPSRRQVVGVVVELVVEQAAPQHFIGLGADPAFDPAGGFDMVERLPVVALDRQERVQPVAELGDQAEPLEAQQRHRIAPGLQAILVPIAHFGRDPMHPGRQAQLVEHLQERLVRGAMKMVVTLDLQAVKVEGGRHAADAVVGLEHHRAVALKRQLVGNGQAHRAGTEHGNALRRGHRRCGVACGRQQLTHQNSKANLL